MLKVTVSIGSRLCTCVPEAMEEPRMLVRVHLHAPSKRVKAELQRSMSKSWIPAITPAPENDVMSGESFRPGALHCRPQPRADSRLRESAVEALSVQAGEPKQRTASTLPSAALQEAEATSLTGRSRSRLRAGAGVPARPQTAIYRL